MAKVTTLDISSTRERTIIDMRKVGWKDVAVLGKYHYTHARKQLPSHTHRKMMEICFCSKGEQLYEVNGEYYTIKGGDIFITYPGEWHGTGVYGEEKGELYWMIIHLDETKKHEPFLHFEKDLAREWRKQLLALPRHFKGNRQMKIRLEKIFSLYAGRKQLINRISMQQHVADFLLDVINSSKTIGNTQKTGRLEKMNRYIQEHIDEPISLSELAELTDLSLSRFKAWCKEETGSTPLDHILRAKIKVAKQQLQKKKTTIASVAYETGFQNPQYFATVFKRFTGSTPGEYRTAACRLMTDYL